MFKSLIYSAVLLLATLGWAQSNDTQAAGASRADEELTRAAEIVNDFTNAAPDKAIPQTVLRDAECIAVIPSMVKGAFVVGANHGSGVASCRTANGWSAPALFNVNGISWGAQIGGEKNEIVMMFMNHEAMENLMKGRFKVGGDVSVAAGPVGRTGAAEAGWKAGILTYARSKGAFIGVSLNGADVSVDDSKTKELYGRDVPFKEILSGQVKTPAAAHQFMAAIQSAHAGTGSANPGGR